MLPTPWLIRRQLVAIRTGAASLCIGLLYCPWLCAGELPGQNAGGCPLEQTTPESDIGVAYANPLRQRLQHLAQLGVTPWHAAGFRGRGLKIVILDSGFRGYQAHLGQALPARVTVRSFRADANLEARNSQHGILCAEVVHALAPDAELLFANWDADQPGQFLEAVRWARSQGARIISCSLIMPSWSDGEGGGPVHAALSQLLAQGDMLCFASAGNTAQRHWLGEFHAAADGWHEWTAGHEENVLMPWSSDEVSVEVCCSPDTHFELCVVDGHSHELMARSGTQNSAGPCSAVARFKPASSRSYCVRVRRVGGPASLFHLVALGASLQYTTTRGSIPFPADGPEIVAVGAVDADGHRASYSSCGPNSSRPKPDLVAPVPFPSLWRLRPFSGTSASAPQAAAMAALIWSRRPAWTAAQVWDTLRQSARDLGPPGHDFETGYGLIQLPFIPGK
ncbi:MAG TPA: S8 family serine peptidase [Gemmataceae bacterium]|nr:S8 family serine peptidase [Gemmataceae bacterium]